MQGEAERGRSLANELDEILATESPEQAKDLLRLLIEEIRVHDRRRIVPTYRVRRRFAQYLLRWAKTRY
jgi:hypothetical protein